jgi:hypothetical protein
MKGKRYRRSIAQETRHLRSRTDEYKKPCVHIPRKVILDRKSCRREVGKIRGKRDDRAVSDRS